MNKLLCYRCLMKMLIQTGPKSTPCTLTKSTISQNKNDQNHHYIHSLEISSTLFIINLHYDYTGMELEAV